MATDRSTTAKRARNSAPNCPLVGQKKTHEVILYACTMQGIDRIALN